MNAHPLSMKAATAVLPLAACLALLAACGDGAKSPAKTPSVAETPTAGDDFRLSSEAFGPDEQIPVIHTCDGHNTSPPLAWPAPPDGTNAFALIMDDPDAPGGTFTHWVLIDLPPGSRTLTAGVEASERPPVGGAQGGNDADGIGYTGPCPPPGDPHGYRFTLYALDQAVGLEPGASKGELLAAMEGHVLAEAELVGTYGR
jgi:Raf kinase inhibitor-like YbhB/YbcL family protein